MTKRGEDEAFLARWSRRKLEAQDEPAAQAAEEAPSSDDGVAALEEAEAKQLEESQALSADDVEKLTPDSDYTVYMRKGVAPHVKAMALRKLWRSDPVLANLDGLNDFGGEIGEVATSANPVISSWMAGRGYDFAKLAPEDGSEGEAATDAPQEITEARDRPGGDGVEAASESAGEADLAAEETDNAPSTG